MVSTSKYSTIPNNLMNFCEPRIGNSGVIFIIICIFKDVGQKMKEQFKMFPDEFVTSPLAAKARVCTIIVCKTVEGRGMGEGVGGGGENEEGGQGGHHSNKIFRVS